MRAILVVSLVVLLCPAGALAQTAPAPSTAPEPPAATAAPRSAPARGGDITRDQYIERAVERARVADIDRAIAFYEAVLGLHVERRLKEIGLVQLRAGSAMIDLVPRTEDEDDGRNMDHFAVRIAEMDVPTLTAHLKRHGIDPGEV